ncbi:MAG: acyltransferase [Burkholderiales bacterium]|nr:acyltransferase [Burkholderiales bacterium]MDE1925911.1 acyltransferase [Burkholderiales bacterium]MDE2157428.1 acyltransferase [Burkholderiales bacterium]
MRTLWRWMLTQTWWRLRLRALGRRSILYRPLLVAGAGRIRIGDRCTVREAARLEVIARPEVGWIATLEIGNGVNIEQGVHIVSQCRVVIGDNVSITPYCVIVDTAHPYDPPDTLPKIGARLPDRASHVEIGAGTFVGAHSIILPDVTIGRGCVIGAGSVVAHDVPDYALVVGSPARIVKIFDPRTRIWNPA